MSLLDVVIVAGVLFGFAYLIFAKLHANNPELIDKIKGWFDENERKKIIASEKYQQVWQEKRELI
jgi:hypothetical protein